MLTLTRRAGQSISIGGEIEVAVVDIGRGKVRIGIKAPRSFSVYRTELFERIEQENLLAARETAKAPQQAEPNEAFTLFFHEGIPGMRSHKRWMLYEVEGVAGMRALVSMQDRGIRLFVLDATEFDRNYPIGLAQQASGLADSEVAVALVVTIPAVGNPTVNLYAPIVIGLESRSGVQVLLEGTDLPVRHEIGLAPEHAPPPA